MKMHFTTPIGGVIYRHSERFVAHADKGTGEVAHREERLREVPRLQPLHGVDHLPHVNRAEGRRAHRLAAEHLRAGLGGGKIRHERKRRRVLRKLLSAPGGNIDLVGPCRFERCQRVVVQIGVEHGLALLL